MRAGASGGGLRFLGLDARRGRALSPLPLEEARRRAAALLPRARPPRYGVASGDLASAGWGVVLPPGEDGAIRDALEPLLRRRREQAGERYRRLEVMPGADASSFRTALGSAHGRADPRSLPWYLLLVGDAGRLPFGLEHDLAPSHAVGRLPFRDPEDLAAYAERVVSRERAAERTPAGKGTRRAAVFAPAHAGDAPTELCVEHLARPVAEAMVRGLDGHPRPGVEVETAFGGAATKARLAELFGAPLDLLVTAGHGLYYPPGDPWQRRRQGALVCADWPGEVGEARPILASESFAAVDLEAGALDGGVAVLFGCYTAGTPRLDLFDSLDPGGARPAAEEPFAAALAERLLGQGGGASAVLGHVGRAFEAGFHWRGVRQSAALEDAVRSLLDGRRLGEAVDGLGQRYADLAVSWTRPGLEPGRADPDPLDLWIALLDARAWSLLGDPAVRLAGV